METKLLKTNTPAHYTAGEVFSEPNELARGFTQKNYWIGMHSQGFYEVNIVLRGEAEHYIGRRRIRVGVGDTFIIPPDVMHGYDGGKGFDVYHILLSPGYFEKNGAYLQLLPSFSTFFRVDPLMRERTSSNIHFRLTEEEIDALSPRLEELARRSRRPGAVNAIITNSEALSVIALLCEMFDARRASTDTLAENEEEGFLKSLAYIYENCAEKLTVEKLCRIAGMSRTSYIQGFKRVTGLPPAEFVRRHRVDTAKLLLSETSLSEAEIAQRIGCTDTSHLIKLFISVTSFPPSHYRH